MIEITNTKETQDNLDVPVFPHNTETCEVKEFTEPENVHQGLELPKFMETKQNEKGKTGRTVKERTWLLLYG